MNKPLKIIFAGTPIFAEKHLLALLSSCHDIVGVFTKPDQPSGRGRKILFSKIKILAIKHNIPLFQPSKLNTQEVHNLIKKLNPDLMLVIAYGFIIPETIINLLPLGCINIHPSLLPRWRGPAPIQWAILSGDKKTGITVIKMNNHIDAGEILYLKSCHITLYDTYNSLQKKLILLGIESMLSVLYQLSNNIHKSTPQNDHNITYAKKINKIDAKLNWNINAMQLERYVRAFNPSPVTFFIFNNIHIKVWQAKTYISLYKNKKIGEIIIFDKTGMHINTIDGIFNIQQIQIPGKKIVTINQFFHSKKSWFKIGDILH